MSGAELEAADYSKVHQETVVPLSGTRGRVLWSILEASQAPFCPQNTIYGPRVRVTSCMQKVEVCDYSNLFAATHMLVLVNGDGLFPGMLWSNQQPSQSFTKYISFVWVLYQCFIGVPPYYDRNKRLFLRIDECHHTIIIKLSLLSLLLEEEQGGICRGQLTSLNLHQEVQIVHSKTQQLRT